MLLLVMLLLVMLLIVMLLIVMCFLACPLAVSHCEESADLIYTTSPLQTRGGAKLLHAQHLDGLGFGDLLCGLLRFALLALHRGLVVPVDP